MHVLNVQSQEKMDFQLGSDNMDTFINLYTVLDHQSDVIERHVDRLRSELISARTELENMTPVYKDFPSLVMRSEELESIIFNRIDKLNVLDSYNKRLSARLSEMRTVIANEYITVIDRTLYSYKELYTKKNEYDDMLLNYRTQELDESQLIANMYILSSHMYDCRTQFEEFKYLRPSDVKDLYDLYKFKRDELRKSR